MTIATNLDSLKEQIIPILRKHDVIRAGIFGSFARREARTDSDVDILIEFDPSKTKSLLDLSASAIELEDALGREVDVVTYRSLNPRIRDQVLTDQDAVMRRIEILGEAARLLPSDWKQKHPEVPWQQITGMRNHLIHGYFSVDLDLAWVVVQRDAPELERPLRQIVDQDPPP